MQRAAFVVLVRNCFYVCLQNIAVNDLYIRAFLQRLLQNRDQMIVSTATTWRAASERACVIVPIPGPTSSTQSSFVTPAD